MQTQSYSAQYQELQLLQSHPSDDFKLYLVKEKSTGLYRTAKKTSIYDCSDDSQDKMLNQVKILKQLENPHIIKYFDVFLEGDDFILILEFCEEGDLEFYVQRKKEKKQLFSEKLILSWVLQILMGLQYTHSKNIIHRLVMSRNIYMNHQGDLKLGSFGGAKMLESTMEKAMTIVGLPCNLSPEMVQGKAYDNKIDIWGLGCLIYELTTHQHPFKITNLPQLYQLIVKTPPQDLPIKYSKYLNPIYKKMMKKNPAFRPSAAELLQQEVFIKLMKQYTKKKKIDSLDLRQVIPKQLLTHNKNRNTNKLLPPIQNAKSSSFNETKTKTPIQRKKNISDNSQPTPRSKEKQNGSNNPGTARLPSLTGKTSDSEQQTFISPKTNHKQEKTSLPSVHKEKKSSPQSNKQKSVQVQNSQEKERQRQKEKEKENTKQRERQKEAQKAKQREKQNDKIEQMQLKNESKLSASNQNRLTLPDLMEGQYISLLCQIKLELLQKKYSPNMSQIFEQTIEFEQEE